MSKLESALDKELAAIAAGKDTLTPSPLGDRGQTGQTKRWTAEGHTVLYDGYGVADCCNDRVTPKRLAACADLLRGQDDLSAVAVMAWADVDKVRAELAQLIGHGHTSAFARRCTERALALLPVPPKGD